MAEETVAEESSANTEEVSAAAEEQSASMEQISSSAERLANFTPLLNRKKSNEIEFSVENGQKDIVHKHMTPKDAKKENPNSIVIVPSKLV